MLNAMCIYFLIMYAIDRRALLAHITVIASYDVILCIFTIYYRVILLLKSYYSQFN